MLGRALGGDAAVGQNHHMVGDAKGLLQLVRHKHAGQAHGVIELADQVGRRTQRNRVQAGKRLVVHHQLGVQGNSARQRNAPGHAARDFAGHQITGAAQTDGI